MTKKIITPYFPSGMKYVAAPLCFAAALFLVLHTYYVWSLLLLLTGVLVFTTHYVMEMSIRERYIKDYLSIVGIKMNTEIKKFNNLDQITIVKGNYAQTVNTRVQSRQMNWSDYTATLIMDNRDSLDLLTRTDKHELLKELKPFSDFLQVGVEDRTVAEPYWIDMTKIE